MNSFNQSLSGPSNGFDHLELPFLQVQTKPKVKELSDNFPNPNKKIKTDGPKASLLIQDGEFNCRSEDQSLFENRSELNTNALSLTNTEGNIMDSERKNASYDLRHYETQLGFHMNMMTEVPRFDENLVNRSFSLISSVWQLSLFSQYSNGYKSSIEEYVQQKEKEFNQFMLKMQDIIDTCNTLPTDVPLDEIPESPVPVKNEKKVKTKRKIKKGTNRV